MIKIVIDPGHGGSNRANRGPTGYIEADGVLDISLKVRDKLASKGYNLILTRDKDETVPLYNRPEKANQEKADLFLSFHTNAAGDSSAGGVEVICTQVNEWNNKEHAAEAQRVSKIIQEKLVKATGLKDRGVKTRLVDYPSSPIHNKDYYAVTRRANMPSLIIESGFHSNPKEEALLKQESFREKIAQAVYEGIVLAYPLSNTLTSIMGKTVADVSQMVSFALKGNQNPKLPNCTLEALAQMFIEEAALEGVRADGAWAQSLKETGYFRYGGIVLPEQNNYGGIGALNDNKKGEAASFETPRIGVRAQIQHLKAYASKENLIDVCVDPRFNLVKRGSAAYFEWLGYSDNPNGAGWAWLGKGYGYDIVKLLNLILQEPIAVKEDYRTAAFKKLIENKVITTPSYWENKLSEPITTGDVMALLANML